MHYGSGMFGGMGLHWWHVTFVLIVLCTVCAWSQVPSGHNQGAAAEGDTIGEQRLKGTQLGSSGWRGRNWGTVAEADAIREQQLKRTQSVRSGHASLLLSRGATAWGCWCIKAGGYTRLMQMGWTKQDLWSICLQWWENRRWELVTPLHCESCKHQMLM